MHSIGFESITLFNTLFLWVGSVLRPKGHWLIMLLFLFTLQYFSSSYLLEVFSLRKFDLKSLVKYFPKLSIHIPCESCNHVNEVS